MLELAHVSANPTSSTPIFVRDPKMMKEISELSATERDSKTRKWAIVAVILVVLVTVAVVSNRPHAKVNVKKNLWVESASDATCTSAQSKKELVETTMLELAHVSANPYGNATEADVLQSRFDPNVSVEDRAGSFLGMPEGSVAEYFGIFVPFDNRLSSWHIDSQSAADEVTGTGEETVTLSDNTTKTVTCSAVVRVNDACQITYAMVNDTDDAVAGLIEAEFDVFDANRDGTLSRSEFLDGLATKTGISSRVLKSRLVSHRVNMLYEMIRRADKNIKKPGGLTKAHFMHIASKYEWRQFFKPLKSKAAWLAFTRGRADEVLQRRVVRGDDQNDEEWMRCESDWDCKVNHKDPGNTWEARNCKADEEADCKNWNYKKRCVCVCIWDGSMVMKKLVDDGRVVKTRVDTIEAGDWVATDDAGTFDMVMWVRKDKKKGLRVPVKKLVYRVVGDEGDEGVTKDFGIPQFDEVVLTGHHLLYNWKNSLVRADDYSVGDELRLSGGRRGVVVSAEWLAEPRGVRSLWLVRSNYFLANGVKTSSTVHSELAVRLQSIFVMGPPRLLVWLTGATKTTRPWVLRVIGLYLDAFEEFGKLVPRRLLFWIPK